MYLCKIVIIYHNAALSGPFVSSRFIIFPVLYYTMVVDIVVILVVVDIFKAFLET